MDRGIFCLKDFNCGPLTVLDNGYGSIGIGEGSAIGVGVGAISVVWIRALAVSIGE